MYFHTGPTILNQKIEPQNLESQDSKVCKDPLAIFKPWNILILEVALYCPALPPNRPLKVLARVGSKTRFLSIVNITAFALAFFSYIFFAMFSVWKMIVEGLAFLAVGFTIEIPFIRAAADSYWHRSYYYFCLSSSIPRFATAVGWRRRRREGGDRDTPPGLEDHGTTGLS